MKFKYLSISVLCFLGFTCLAQEKWSLSKCVDYAVENNIQLNQSVNQIRNQEVNYFESKASILPSINAGSEYEINFGRSIDGSDNSVTFDQTYTNSYGISASIDLFSGLVKYNTMAYNRYLLSATQMDSEKEKNQLIYKVLSSYYTVLYSQGLMQVAQKQCDVAEQQFHRMEKMVEVGKESLLNAQELKSQWANDKLTFIQARNNANSEMLNLKQLIRVGAGIAFDIDTIPIDALVAEKIPEVDSVFKKALELMPEIKYYEYMVKASEKQLSIAKGNVSPNIYLSTGYYTYYYDANTENAVTESFQNQLKDNQNEIVTLGISIPLFNGASRYSSIQRQKISKNNYNLELEKQKEALYTSIWSAIDDLNSAQSEYESSLELLDLSRLSFENTTKKLEKGLSSATDFEAAKQRLMSAEAGLLKAKLIYRLRKQMLQFYLNGNWDHL